MLGGVTLGNVVLKALPSYGMQLHWFPRSICDHLDRTVRNFIQKGHTNRGLHMVGWKITRPKRDEGLRVRVARCQNTTLLGKMVWDMVSGSNKLWVELLKTIYYPNGSLFNAKKVRIHYWNSIQKSLPHLVDGFEFKCGNGMSSLQLVFESASLQPSPIRGHS